MDWSTEFTISEGDTYPQLRVRALTRDDQGNEVPLAGLNGATVRFDMVNEATGVVVPNPGEAIVENALTGILAFTFDGTQRRGVYWGDFDVELVSPANAKATVPNTGRKIKVTVTASAQTGD